MREIQRRRGFTDEEFAFIGDDLFDIPLLRAVGLSAAPPNALAEVRRSVHYVTRVAGGEGAVRDFVDRILARRGR
jgi:3-deoxy-D-manno-octulosonate 8-phosphate phosphatase (KDO 8-P phosphatase)